MSLGMDMWSTCPDQPHCHPEPQRHAQPATCAPSLLPCAASPLPSRHAQQSMGMGRRHAPPLPYRTTSHFSRVGAPLHSGEANREGGEGTREGEDGAYLGEANGHAGGRSWARWLTDGGSRWLCSIWGMGWGYCCRTVLGPTFPNLAIF